MFVWIVVGAVVGIVVRKVFEVVLIMIKEANAVVVIASKRSGGTFGKWVVNDTGVCRGFENGLGTCVLGLSCSICARNTVFAVAPTFSSHYAVDTVATEAGVYWTCRTGLVLERGAARSTSRSGLADLETFLFECKYSERIRIT